MESSAIRLRIYISSTDKIEHTLLSEFLVQQARKHDMAGVTVLKGIIGYGSTSVIHSYKFWEVTEKVPLVVEVVDESEKISSFYNSMKPFLESMRYGCLVTNERVEVLLYKSGCGSK